MFKLVMLPTSDKLPALRPWTPEEVALQWTLSEEEEYRVRGFNKQLDAKQEAVTVEEAQVKRATNTRGVISRLLRFIGVKGKLPRATPSQANPSILLGERVDTEDDVLHVAKLPDFDGTLGAKDCELMLQYLTAPYMRIPMLLRFFSSEARLKALRTFKIQEVLDAALFEPGQWQEEYEKATPMEVPAPTRDHMCTPVGLLFNELVMAPSIVFNSVFEMLDRVVEMDTGKYSALGESILYVLRLAVRVEGYMVFLMKNNLFHKKRAEEALLRGGAFNGAFHEANVRGLRCEESTIEEAVACQQKLRQLLENRVFRILARWIKKAKEEGKMSTACMLHAHMAYIYRNVQAEDLTPTVVFAVLSCQIFLFNNYKYDLDLDLKAGETERSRSDDNEEVRDDLGIPQVELFDLFQINRVKMMDWLATNADGRNAVMDAIVQMVEEGKKRISEAAEGVEEEEEGGVRSVRNWISIEQAGLNFRGRFVPDNEFDEGTFDALLSPEARVNFEAWLRETTTLAVNTEINIQLGEFTIKKHVTQPLEAQIQDHADFVQVFQGVTVDDIIQCAEVKHTTNRKWSRLVGLGHDVLLWTRDTRRPVLPDGRPYEEDSAQWLRDILEPWRSMVLTGVELSITSAEVDTADTATLYGFTLGKADDAEFIPTLKEVRVYRYPRVFHIFNIVEHGRRWYRSMVFSSDPVCTLHQLPMETFFIDKRLYQCCGNPKQKVPRTSSLVITRYIDENVEAAQTFLPLRLLYGILPAALLESYNFWQNADESVTGYMPSKNLSHQARSIVNIRLTRGQGEDRNGFGFSNATAAVCRIFTLEDPDVRDYSFYTTPDVEKAPLFLVDLLAVLSSYNRSHQSATRTFGPPSVSQEFLQFDDEHRTLHALIRSLLRLESLSHILAWSRTDPGKGPLPVDVIELPRLRLTFERVVAPDGGVKYMCLEQSGMHVAASTSDLKFRPLLDGLPNALLLANQDNEYSVLVPATVKPGLVMTEVHQAFKLTCSMMDQNWIEATGESRYFLYPVHASGCFMASHSIAATLYLLVLRLMTRHYTEAFRLIESCVCDRAFTAQEAQIFSLIGANRDCLLADAYACRLKLYFVTYGCQDIMPYSFDVSEDLHNYINTFSLVSSACRLTADEELFIMHHIPDDSPARTVSFTNRQRILLASFDRTFEAPSAKQHVKNVTPFYPPKRELAPYNTEKLDMDLLNVDTPSFKGILQKLAFVNYKRPEPMHGPPAIEYLNEIFKKNTNLGFFVYYEMFIGALEITILKDQDPPAAMASVLFRTLPDSYISGLQRVLLAVMETHPDLAAKMPPFEDKRRMKLPSLAGLDIFQTHIKAVAMFIKTNRSELDINRLAQHVPEPFVPPQIIRATDTLEDSADFSAGRSWLNPRILDFTCQRRVVAASSIPPLLTSFVAYFQPSRVAQLATAPLDEIGLDRFVEHKSLAMRGDAPVQVDSPLRVLGHPSSRSHVARTSVLRLEGDIRDFAADENQTVLPVMKAVGLAALMEKSSLDSAVGEMFKIITALLKLRDGDSAFVKTGLGELLNFCNGEHPRNGNNVRAMGHMIRQEAQSEMALDLEFLAASCATDSIAGNLQRCNPFLSQADGAGITCCVMLLMMTVNRVNHANLALQQARGVLKLLKGLQKSGIDPTTAQRTRKELLSLSETLAVTLANRRHYSAQLGVGTFEVDPRFLLFEFSHGLVLRQSQVTLVRRLLADMAAGTSVCHQMIMGAGKTTVVGPLVAMLVANATTMVMEVVPPALLDFSAGVLRERFSAGIRKPVFTFSFDRYNEVTPALLCKLQTARIMRAVVVSTPSSIKSFMLKFLEICHNLSRHKNLQLEAKETMKAASIFSIKKVRALLGLGNPRTLSSGELTLSEIEASRRQAVLAADIFKLFRGSVEIMDEVDIILHPLKSELNWPLGAKEPLDFTRSRVGNGLRWGLPAHLLDAIFACTGIPIIADIADSKVAMGILAELEQVLALGFSTLQLQRSPHLALVSKNFYDARMKSVLAKWLLLWLRARKMPALEDDEIVQFLLHGNTCAQTLQSKIKSALHDEHLKMLNLGHDWLNSFLPFVLQKVNRVHFGLLKKSDIRQLEEDGVRIPTSRKLVAVPFVAKDVPSRASEFAHPDILTGLTILAYRYEGMRKSDFTITLRYLRECMEEEDGPYKDRPSCLNFEQWVLNAGKAIRGSKRREKGSKRASIISQQAKAAPKKKAELVLRDKKNGDRTIGINVFADVFTEEDDLIWPLQLIDPMDTEQFKVLYPLLYKLPHTVMHYLNDIIFPEVLAHQGLKLSACGQELGGDLLFGKRIGFSGTPSDILPLELGQCQYERGSDGRVTHYLTSPSVVQSVSMPAGWDAHSLLDYIAKADPPFHALIDTGALITGMSNRGAAEYLLQAGLAGLKGVVFLDELDRQMVLLRKGLKVVRLSDSGLAWNERFTFYDQVHTTGMDIKQAVDASAALTLG
ncbi:hypothetical protein B484DRAFT_93375, partial [Ochromonadaceae sp. CCMP2298]